MLSFEELYVIAIFLGILRHRTFLQYNIARNSDPHHSGPEPRFEMVDKVWHDWRAGNFGAKSLAQAATRPQRLPFKGSSKK